jgi:dual specificity tyrosine-phosphorylation-regulated kinase 1
MMLVDEHTLPFGYPFLKSKDDNDTSSVSSRDPRLSPIYKLSVGLIHTYKHINKVYYEQKARKQLDQAVNSKESKKTNEKLDFIFEKNEVIHDRYTLLKVLGKGAFGQVILAADKETGNNVAIKINKAKEGFRRASQLELGYLKKIQEHDLSGGSNTIRLYEEFNYLNHPCMVFELLSRNLYELIKATR